MKDSIHKRLESITERHVEIGHLLSQPDAANDQNRFRDLTKEYSRLQPVVDIFNDYLQVENDIAEAEEMLNEDDADMRDMAQAELQSGKARRDELAQLLRIELLPRDVRDSANVFLEVRAGTGGDEAAIFAGDLYRMYQRYAENHGWRVEQIDASEGEHGGYSKVVARLIGDGVYSRLKFESGAHRVQRVPETESQGRIHTSACTVAILAEAEEVDDVEINSADIRTDTYRASGAGGQHVNKTDSAVRLTHVPSGIVVECQDERSQHKNRARAMSLLKARLLDIAQEKIQNEQARDRKLQVGSGDRSERIRTYNYPQGRVTDHRINLTLYKLESIIEGDLEPVIDPLIAEHQAELLASLGDA